MKSDLRSFKGSRVSSPFGLQLLLTAAVLLSSLPAGQVLAQPAGSAQKHTGKRYLLLVETSRAMQKRQPQVAEAVTSLIVSGCNGEMKEGDTIGIWTFNSEVYAGRFPLQKWTADSAKEIAELAKDFLRSQPCEGSAHLETAWPGVEAVAKSSGFLAVVLVTGGTRRIDGTPFDTRINEEFRIWEQHCEQRQLPMVTYLRAMKGKFVSVAVSPAPFNLELPAIPPEPPVKPAHVVAEKATKPSLKVVLPPLIVAGKQTGLGSEPAPESSEAGSHVASVTSLANSNSTQVAREESATTLQTQPAAPKNEVVVSNQPSLTVSPVIPPKLADLSTSAVNSNQAAAKAALASNEQARAQGPGVPSKVAAPQPASTDKGTWVVAARELPSAGIDATSAANKESVAVESAARQEDTAGKAASSSSSVTVITATAPTAPVSTLHPAAQVGMAAAGLIAAGSLFYILRRSRPARRGSLITQSLQRRSGL